MSALSDACRRPFSNGTEGSAWMAAWCYLCEHDHGITHHNSCGDGCDLLMGLMTQEDYWPEAWLPEPDDGEFYLPSRMICAAFKPCHEGECEGDPGAADRAARVAEVTVYWRERVASDIGGPDV